jgi:hypothetical protein
MSVARRGCSTSFLDGRRPPCPAGWTSTHAFRDQVQVVAMDGFAGYKNAATAAVPDAVTVMDPFHVVALAVLTTYVGRGRVMTRSD